MSTETADRLTRATLDVLPVNVAVLDDDGTILLTNRSWRAFGGEVATPPEDAGVNYLEAIDPTTDRYAAEALEGLRAIIDGERELFTLEYPCHAPDERHWFLMRVVRFELDGETRVAVAHLEITERKLAELEAERRAAEVRRERRNLAELLDRVGGLLEAITLGLVQADSRADIDGLVCEEFVAAEPYVAAWIGEPDLARERLVTRASAGDAPDVESVALDPASDDPSALAHLEGELRAVQDLADAPDAPWAERARAVGARSLAAVPLVYGAARYGVVAVYADRPDAFNDRERVVLESLARAVASTINAVEGKRILTATQVVVLELTLADPAFPLRTLADAAGAAVAYEGSVPRADGDLGLFVTLEGGDVEAAVEAASTLEDVTGVTVVTAGDDGALVEVRVRDSVVDRLADHGGVVRGMDADPDGARLVVELPLEANTRAAYDLVEASHPGTEVAAVAERERPARTRGELRAAIDEALTDRQRTALRSAYLSGYFDWPRPVSGDDLASSLGVSRPTFHQHLRAAERKVMDVLYDA